MIFEEDRKLKRLILWLVVAMLAVAAPSLIPRMSPQAATQDDRHKEGQVPESPAEVAYKSSSGRHKIQISDPNVVDTLKARKVRTVGEYGSFTVVEVDTATAEELTGKKQGEWRDDYNVIMLNAVPIDTTSDSAVKMQEAGAVDSTGRRLHLVHFPGPIKPEGYDALLKTGVEIVTYIPNNAYLVYGDRASLRRVKNAARPNGLLQWEAPYGEALKIDPAVGVYLEKGKASQDGVTTQESKQAKGEPQETNLFAIQLYQDPVNNKATRDLIDQLKTEPIRSEFDILKYHNIIVAVPKDSIEAIAKRPDVISIQPYILPKKRDERQNQIMAGNIIGNLPNAADYLAYLAGKGFTQAQFTTSGFAVDVSDDGLENGTINIDHPNLRVGGIAAGATRVVYNRIENSGGPVTPGRTGFEGHGNLNSHVIGGFVNFAFGSGFPHADAAGFRFGLGVAPFVKVGMSTIFNPGFTNPNFANLQSRAYADGARISSNSWGASTGGAYTVDSQAYDALVRDAQPATSVNPTAGNQEMVILFAAGNDGSGANTVGSPGTGKNVITVGAAENVHSHSTANGGNNAAGNDGCGIGDTGADSANDIIFFSSRGPTDDGRKKPDIVGPGTHITGGVAQAPAPGVNGGALATFNALGVCALPGSGTAGDPDNFFPLTQQWYTTSSGTSHSTPAVAGAAALVRQHFINSALTTPSPAMTKGILMNSARYMNGTGANDNLWSNNQGVGETNLNSFFDIFATTNILRDQVAADTFTASGQSRVFTGNVVDNTRPFRVTLAWTDAPGPTSGNAFINNLDLEVTVGGQTYKGNVFVGANSATGGTADPRNNVESVFVPAGVTGPFVVRVLATNIAGDGVPNSGGPLDQDFALIVPNALEVAQPVIASAGATITTESCSPATGTIDPGETVTVSFCLQNVGTLNTTNLVATLGSTGGVTSPSGPQNYGVLVAGGSAVCRDFTFTASGACGDTLTASLALQDGATNLGTVTFTFTLGSLSAPNTTTYSTGNIAVPIPDASSVEVTLNVPDVGIVSDVNARVRLNHTFDGDLVISLVHPDGTVVPLATNRGGGGDNYGTGGNDCSGTHTVFDDSAATAISAGVAPFAGTFRPESPLSALNGKATDGAWKLRVADTLALDLGTIGCVQLEIGRSVFLCCPFTGGMPSIVAAPPAVLTAEGCSPANGAVDPDETVTMDFPLQNNGTGSTTNLVATLQATGGVTAPSGPQNYGSVPPVGGPVSRPFTFTANGSCGGTITATLQLQDGATNLGTVTFTIGLGATASTTTTFSNTAAILIPGTGDSGPANPYPSTINVSGVTETVSKVTATLNTMNHTFPDDIDVLLVGPGGQKLLLMSDVGGSGDIVNITLTFDDAAASLVPDAGPAVSGTFRPSNIGTGDTFPAPAPVGPYPDPQLLSVFNGVDPNGTWSLFVVDDQGGDTGNINGGWTLNITTTTPVCCVSPCTVTCPANITVSNDPNQCGAVVNYPPPTTSGTCGTITCTPPSGSFFPVGTTTVTCTATGDDCTFTVTVSDTQPPSITCPAIVTGVTPQNSCISTGCAVANFTTTASDNCPGVVVACVPPSGSCFPVGATTVTCTATDGSGNTATCSFTVTTFDVCLQDDSNAATKLVFNSATGEYRFCCGGTLYTGTGVVAKQGCTVTLTDSSGGRRVTARVVKSAFSGTASLQSPPGTLKCSITDKDIRNNVCVCP
jgi:subtilisin-like proprotein convertase family protein